jgi:hypothetical protein
MQNAGNPLKKIVRPLPVGLNALWLFFNVKAWEVLLAADW